MYQITWTDYEEECVFILVIIIFFTITVAFWDIDITYDVYY